MRILIDLQGAQSESRYRGIGRYSLSLAKAIAANRGNHEVFIALNAAFPTSIDFIRNAFKDILPAENVVVWYIPSCTAEYDSKNRWRQKAAEIIRENYFKTLHPDIVFISSFMEGFAEDVITNPASMPAPFSTVITLYDLIPYLNQAEYLDGVPSFKTHYLHKIDLLKKADGILAISEYAAAEGKDALMLSDSQVMNMSSACDEIFMDARNRQLNLPPNIEGDYILYTGGVDKRKNLPRLLEAYSKIPKSLSAKYNLVIVGKLKKIDIFKLKITAASYGIDKKKILFTGYVTDEQLAALYARCTLFVFPTWHEGFGLPALEAAYCGAPVIASNTTSLPEVVGCPEALFNPFDVQSITAKLEQTLSDEQFRLSIAKRQLLHAQNFNWNISAQKAIEFFEKMDTKDVRHQPLSSFIEKTTEEIGQINGCQPDDYDLKKTAEALEKNLHALTAVSKLL